MIPFNNPVIKLMRHAKGGGNVVQMMQQMAGQDQQIAQAYEMIQGKSPQQLQQMAKNMAKERRISVNYIINSINRIMQQFNFM